MSTFDLTHRASRRAARAERSGPGAVDSPLHRSGEISPLVAIDDVSFTYPNGVQALDHFTAAVKPGQVLGIVGPSGCGKSSLLSVLAGFARASSGSIQWAASQSERHGLSMVFQKDTLLPWLTVEANVALFGTFNKSKAPDQQFIDELLTLAGLSEFRSAYPYELSGGMRRRTAFVSAMAAMPRLLLLDEPFSSLDEPTRIGIHQDVLEIVHRADTAVILVTHDLGEAATLCDEILVLTSRPATVAVRHTVPFGPDRNVLELRQEQSFLDLYGELWRDLSQQIHPQDHAKTIEG